MILEYLGIGFAAGTLAGIGMFSLFIVYQARRIVKDVRTDLKSKVTTAQQENTKLKKTVAANMKFTEVVSIKLENASKIIEAQNSIAGALQAPSKNALHSKHKNKLVDDWKVLENKKQEIFNNILKTGADPIISVYDNTIKKNKDMKLSELMQMMSSSTLPIDDNSDTRKIQSAVGKGTKVKKVVKNGKTFHVIDGGKSNKTTH